MAPTFVGIHHRSECGAGETLLAVGPGASFDQLVQAGPAPGRDRRTRLRGAADHRADHVPQAGPIGIAGEPIGARRGFVKQPGRLEAPRDVTHLLRQ